MDISLLFLDVLISHLSNGSLTHQVYWKTTHTDGYLHVQSYHHCAPKSIVLKTLITQPFWISTTQFLEKEKSHLIQSLMSTSFSISQINKVFHSSHKHKWNNTSSSSLQVALSYLHYVQGSIHHISRIFTKNNIKKFSKTLKHLKIHSDLLRTKITQSLAEEFTKFPILVENHTLVKSRDPRPFKSYFKESIAETTYNHISRWTIDDILSNLNN